ncbi:MAG: hypothetical protein RMK18_12615, partial [Armatimonadota bacterium]|nr:hypothetical protein [Armatimonadota bacterium]
FSTNQREVDVPAESKFFSPAEKLKRKISKPVGLHSEMGKIVTEKSEGEATDEPQIGLKMHNA